MRVLIIEDHAGIAEAIALALRRDGHQVQRAATGAEVLAAAPSDLVLLDLGLPDIDGFEVLEELRRRGVETPVVIMTARDEPGLRDRALRGGAVGFLQKPFRIDDVRAYTASIDRPDAA